MKTAMFKLLLAESALHFLNIKHDPTPNELFDEMERRGIEFCKSHGVDFKETLTFIQLQDLRGKSK